MTKGMTYVLLFFVMFLWGINVIAVKILVHYFTPVFMQGIRIFIAATVLVTLLYFQRGLRKLNKKEWLYILFASVLGQLLHHGLLAMGLVETTASNSALILGLIPLATAIFSIIFLNDRLTRLRLLGILLGFSGVAIVILQGNEGMGVVTRGDIFVFVSVITQALSFILIRKGTVTIPPKQMTTVMLFVGSMMLLVTSMFIEPNALQNIQNIPMWVWSILLASAILATGIGHIFYNFAISKIGASQTAIFNNLVPFYALVGSFLFLGEPILSIQIIGFFLIVTGVLLGTGYIDKQLIKAKYRRAMHD